MEPSAVKVERDITKDSVSSDPKPQRGSHMDRHNGSTPDPALKQQTSSPTAISNDRIPPTTFSSHQTPKVTYSESFSPHSTVNGSSSPPALTSPFQEANGPVTSSPSTVLANTALRDAQRQINKVRRFLTTLQQFAADISTEAGDKVHTLVLNLLCNTITVEEFHGALQEVTHFPLRPFVLPFLKSHLPLLTRELQSLARRSSMSVHQYISSQESAILESSAGEATDFFSSEVTHTKRKHESNHENDVSSCNSSTSVSITNHNCSGSPPPAKRPCLISPNYPPVGISPEGFGGKDNRNQDDEWKNINVMLTCIMSMVEKTKRALSILQHREDRENGRSAVPSDFKLRSDYENEVKRYATELVAHAIRATEDRVAEVKRKADDAVNEVRRAAVIEVQRAITNAEARAQELVAAERGRIETMLREVARREISGEQKIEAHQACWNCGRKAQDTCSGCNIAKYCGAFCQHKDWEQHHKVCNSALSNSTVLATTLMKTKKSDIAKTES